MLEVKDLRIWFEGNKIKEKKKEKKYVVDGVSFYVKGGEVLGILGESGSGKTLTGLSIIGLLPNGAMMEGEIIFLGKKMKSEKDFERVRGKDITMIMQNPHTALNPVIKVGKQIIESVETHLRIRNPYQMAVDYLKLVEIQDPEKRMRNYPFELSGGMKQRVVIAISTITNPKLIIADEPTTALDVSVQSQVLKLLRRIVDEKKSGMIFISHDISAVGWISDKMLIMYGGWDVEKGKTIDVLKNPLHPYTKGLLSSTLKGSPLDINFSGCRFALRCPIAEKICFEKEPEKRVISDREVRCHLV